eukprot:763323-Hanusia_phi.AAC.3
MNDDLAAAIYEKVNVDNHKRSVKQPMEKEVEAQDSAQQDIGLISCSQFDFFDCHGKFEFMDCVRKRDECLEKRRQQEEIASDIACQACKLIIPFIRNKTVLWLKALAKHKTATSRRKKKSGKEQQAEDVLALSNITRRDFLHLTNNMCTDHKTKSSWVNRIDIIGRTAPYTLKMVDRTPSCDDACQTVTLACHNLLNHSRWSKGADTMLSALKQESAEFLTSSNAEVSGTSLFEKLFCKDPCLAASDSSEVNSSRLHVSQGSNTSKFQPLKVGDAGEMVVQLRRGKSSKMSLDHLAAEDCCLNTHDDFNHSICSQSPSPTSSYWVEAAPLSTILLASVQKKVFLGEHNSSSPAWRRGVAVWGLRCKGRSCGVQGKIMRQGCGEVKRIADMPDVEKGEVLVPSETVSVKQHLDGSSNHPPILIQAARVCTCPMSMITHVNESFTQKFLRKNQTEMKAIQANLPRVEKLMLDHRTTLQKFAKVKSTAQTIEGVASLNLSDSGEISLLTVFRSLTRS